MGFLLGFLFLLLLISKNIPYGNKTDFTTKGVCGNWLRGGISVVKL